MGDQIDPLKERASFREFQQTMSPKVGEDYQHHRYIQTEDDFPNNMDPMNELLPHDLPEDCPPTKTHRTTPCRNSPYVTIPKSHCQIVSSEETMSFPDTEENLHARFEQFQQDLHPLLANFEEKKILDAKLKDLFSLDEGDPNQSIQEFYKLTVHKLTAFVFAVQTLDSGMVSRSKGWKDKIFDALLRLIGCTANILGAVSGLTMGGASIAPIAVLPILIGVDEVWKRYRDGSKRKEFHRASVNFDGGFESIEIKNRYIAYDLASLLQMQLRYCTREGAQTIVNDWIYRLCYNLLKYESGENFTEEQLKQVTAIITLVTKGKEQKSTVQTYAKERNWNTLGLFKRAGIAYEDNGKIYYESCFIQNNDSEKTVALSKAEKYGYLFLSTKEEAECFKAAKIKEFEISVSEELRAKWKKENKILCWKEDNGPRGIKLYAADKHLKSPTILRAHQPTTSQSNPKVPQKTRLTPNFPIETDRIELAKQNTELEAQLKQQSDRLKQLEEQMAVLLEGTQIPSRPENRPKLGA